MCLFKAHLGDYYILWFALLGSPSQEKEWRGGGGGGSEKLL